MKLIIHNLGYCPPELYEQAPFTVETLREFPGPDRPDYWLLQATRPLRWLDGAAEKQVTHLVAVTRWRDTKLDQLAQYLPMSMAYVTDLSLIDDAILDFAKCKYNVIGLANGEVLPPKREGKTIRGVIAPQFGLKGGGNEMVEI